MEGVLVLAIGLSLIALAISALSLVHSRRLSSMVRRHSKLLEALLNMADLSKTIEKARKAAAMKPRRRYIVFEVIPGDLDHAEVEAALNETLRKLVGIVGESSSRMKLLYFDKRRSRGIIRIRREHKYLALAVLGLTRSIAGRRVIVIPLAVTGSIKRAKRLIGKNT